MSKEEEDRLVGSLIPPSVRSNLLTLYAEVQEDTKDRPVGVTFTSGPTTRWIRYLKTLDQAGRVFQLLQESEELEEKLDDMADTDSRFSKLRRAVHIATKQVNQ